MSMSTHAVGFKPADDKWNRMKAVWRSCVDAGVSIPQDVLDYFDGEYPGDNPGMEVDLGDACAEYCDSDRGCDGYQIDVTLLPEGVRYIRVYNSW